MAAPADLVVGTAGHVDHGKTSLVRRLTGVDLDVLPEEQERGITIALGFAPFDLPDGRRIAFVDVPGHERLVRTMIAGAAGIDAALLCVSAVEGVMPQTREHVAILELLGVRQVAVVLTMADLVDHDLLALAIEEARDALAGTAFEGVAVVPFSSVTGAGRDAVVEVLGGFARGPRGAGGAFRLPIDRVFVRPGFGTVVTGTVWSGTLREGEPVTLVPGDKKARVRGIQVHGEGVAEARAGWRAALNLAGVDAGDLARGQMVVTGPVPAASVLDVRYRHLPDAEPLPDETEVRLLIGTGEALGRIHLAQDLDVLAPGAEAWAQVRLEEPLAALPGDRFVLRRPSPAATLGGGAVVDPWAPRMRTRERVAYGKQIARLAGGALDVWLDRAGEDGLSPEDWAFRAPGRTAVALGDRVFGAPVVARLEGALLEALRAWHAANPLAAGAPRRELRRERLGHLSEKGFDGLVERLAASGLLVAEGPLVRLSGFRVVLGEGRRALLDRVAATVASAGLAGCAGPALAAAHPDPETESLVRLLAREGRVIDVPGVGWVDAAVAAALAERLRAWFGEHDHLAPGEFKELTGLSRKGAIPWLEWLDARKWTRRTGDTRSKGPAL